jgi:hypothetical protein
MRVLRGGGLGRARRAARSADGGRVVFFIVVVVGKRDAGIWRARKVAWPILAERVFAPHPWRDPPVGGLVDREDDVDRRRTLYVASQQTLDVKAIQVVRRAEVRHRDVELPKQPIQRTRAVEARSNHFTSRRTSSHVSVVEYKFVRVKADVRYAAYLCAQ